LRRYSAGYGGLGLRIVNTSCAKDYVSTKPGQLHGFFYSLVRSSFSE